MSAAEVLPLLKEILGRLGTIESQLGISGSGSSGGGDSGELPRSIRAYDEYSTTKVDPFVEVCNKLGGDAATLGQLVKAAWDEMRSFLLMASACKEPPQAKLTELFMKVAERQKAVANSVQRNEWEKHCKTCAEGVQALNWLMVKPAPRDFIEAYIGGSDYWANNIRREYRATNPDQVAFCDTFKAMIMELMVYVKEYHTTGVSWNPKGVDVSEYAGGVPAAVSVPVASSAPAAAPAAVAATTTSASSDSKPAVGMGNIFAGVKDGESVTSGLKKVTKDMQTWRSEYKGGEAPAPVKAKPAPASKVSEVKGTPKCEFQQAASRWQVEYQNETNGVVEINIGDIKETVYILGCAGTSPT
jgi:adenylyl cyclase-associated protein